MQAAVTWRHRNGVSTILAAAIIVAALMHVQSVGSTGLNMIQISKPDFSIGKLLATPAALEALQEADVDLIDLVEGHIGKDWGDLSDVDKRLNDEALHDGTRILSAYILPTEVKIWIITEAADDNGQRAATTALLPEEY